MSNSLSVEDLEALWERLAEAIDQAGNQRETLFLSKLVLLLMATVGDRQQAERLINTALEDLT